MSHLHQFIQIQEIDRQPIALTAAGKPNRAIPGVIAGCMLCGEIRRIMSNGELTILVYGKEEDAQASN